MRDLKIKADIAHQALGSLIYFLLLWFGPLPSFSQPKPVIQERVVYYMTIEGVINPLTSRYLQRGIEQAQAASAQAVVVQLNTPGGLESSMREMVQAILSSRTPVIVFVAPPGARAASAGMFITIASHVAAMSPGTNIGAAHPVALGGSREGELDPTMAEKVANDASALARSIATERHRNVQWAEAAVRESVSITEGEALNMHVIDLVAPDLDTLLRKVDGRQVAMAGAVVDLRTKDARIIEQPMNLAERILQTVIDPNIAYLLMTIGFLGIIAEFYHPGMVLPGLTGVIALVLAFTAFGSLPINWAGITLLGLAFLLFVLELHTPGTGALAGFGLVAFVLGSLMLYRPLTPVSPALPRVNVDPGLIAAMAAVVGAFFILVLRAVLKVRSRPVAIGPQKLLGTIGVALSDLRPAGIVRLDSEQWSAVAEPDWTVIPAGSHVEVLAVEGVTLKVRPAPQPRLGEGQMLPEKEIGI